MLTFGALSFSAPWLLLGLAALPVLWWLLKISPPAPNTVRFPALRLLLGLDKDDQTAAKMPWWLLALRAALAAIILLALAGPLWNAADRSARSGPLILIVDTGWASAPGWPLREATLRTLIEEASRDRRAVMLLPTAARDVPAFSLLSAEEARRAAARLEPQPYAPNRRALFDKKDDLATLLADHADAEMIWLSDGLDYGAARAFADGFAALAPLTVLSEPRARRALSLAPPEPDGSAVSVPVLRAYHDDNARRSGTVRLLDDNGRVLGTSDFVFEAGESRTRARFDLPVEVRNRATRIDIAGHPSAGATLLLDASWRRRPVGLVSGSGFDDDRPLLANLFYLRRAMAPYADLREGDTGALIESGLSVLILSDVGQIVGDAYTQVASWVDKGGVLIRFAGPRMAEQSDDLIPVALRRGGRALGGTLSWDTPQGLAPFPDESPFAGLDPAADVTVSRQVLAEPAPDLDDHTWARLADGTPLVTARRRGQGWLVLVHVTANQDWSSLPLSGLYVQMLRRLVALSPGLSVESNGTTFSAPLAPIRTLTGLGALVSPPSHVLPLTREVMTAAPSPRHPPGLYGRPGAERAYNLSQGTALLKTTPAFDAPVTETGYLEDSVNDLRPALILLAILLALADLIATLRLSGHGAQIMRLARRHAGALFIGIALTVIINIPHGVSAQTRSTEPALDAARLTHLAYIETGDGASDALTRQGLQALSTVLTARTAFEPGAAVGVDPATDDLVFYPLLYWRITPNQQPLTSEALVRIDQFMKNGGTILFDTADHADHTPGLDAAGLNTAQGILRAILSQLDIPPLTTVPDEHVLRKAFYLLSEFPGRYAGGTVWVQARDAENNAPSRHDGVSPIIIGANDWAAAWAKDTGGQPLVATTPGGERQRELAYRFGVNLVMYTLSGNYKADQVHVPAILERLGQ